MLPHIPRYLCIEILIFFDCSHRLKCFNSYMILSILIFRLLFKLQSKGTLKWIFFFLFLFSEYPILFQNPWCSTLKIVSLKKLWPLMWKWACHMEKLVHILAIIQAIDILISALSRWLLFSLFNSICLLEHSNCEMMKKQSNLVDICLLDLIWILIGSWWKEARSSWTC